MTSPSVYNLVALFFMIIMLFLACFLRIFVRYSSRRPVARVTVTFREIRRRENNPTPLSITEIV